MTVMIVRIRIRTLNCQIQIVTAIQGSAKLDLVGGIQKHETPQLVPG